MIAVAAPAGPCAAGAGFSRAAAAELVPSKTTAGSGIVINFAPSAVAERRVKRLKKSVWASGHLHGVADYGKRPPVCWFVTLTYDTKGTLGKGRHDWKADHITYAVKNFRNWCVSRKVDCRYTWVAELQGRGTVHYHLLVWLPVGVQMPHWDKPTRKRGGYRVPCWPYGYTDTQKAKSGVGYLMKYLSKLGELTRFPKGLRLYGIGGLNQTGKNVRSWLNLPEWVKRSFGVGEIARRKIGLVVQGTGEILEPMYAVSLMPAGLIVRALRELPARFHDGAYSSVNFA